MEMFTTLDGPAVIDSGRESRFLPTSPAFYAHVRVLPVGILPYGLVRKKTRMVWLPNYEKNEDMITLFSPNRRKARHQDGRTDSARQRGPRLYNIASRCKNRSTFAKVMPQTRVTCSDLHCVGGFISAVWTRVVMMATFLGYYSG